MEITVVTVKSDSNPQKTTHVMGITNVSDSQIVTDVMLDCSG